MFVCGLVNVGRFCTDGGQVGPNWRRPQSLGRHQLLLHHHSYNAWVKLLCPFFGIAYWKILVCISAVFFLTRWRGAALTVEEEVGGTGMWSNLRLRTCLPQKDSSGRLWKVCSWPKSAAKPKVFFSLFHLNVLFKQPFVQTTGMTQGKKWVRGIQVLHLCVTHWKYQ